MSDRVSPPTPKTRSRVSLFLMEQVIAVLIFALAAALCVQIFVYSQLQTTANIRQDQAVLLLSDAVEACQAAGGDLELTGQLLGQGEVIDSELQICYNDQWQPVDAGNPDQAEYVLSLSMSATEQSLLQQGRAVLRRGEHGEEIYSLEFATQEVRQ